MTAAVSFRKLSIFILLSLLMLLYTGSVLAQDATSAANTPVRRTLPVVAQGPAAAVVADRLETLREKIASKEAALKQRLATFRDKQKAAVAQRVNTNLNLINQRITSQMLTHLQRMSAILDKLEARVDSGSPEIKDVNLALTVIASASASITAATDAANLQLEKDYTLNANTTEARVGQDAQNMRRQLHSDLQILRNLVIEAKQAVANAIRVAKSGLLEIPVREATESGQ